MSDDTKGENDVPDDFTTEREAKSGKFVYLCVHCHRGYVSKQLIRHHRHHSIVEFSLEHPKTSSLIKKAIAKRKIIEFKHKGQYKIGEPHVFGISKGERELLFYQIGKKGSSQTIPNWKRVKLKDISRMIVTQQNFNALRMSRKKNLGFTQILAIVK